MLLGSRRQRPPSPAGSFRASAGPTAFIEGPKREKGADPHISVGAGDR